IVSRGIRTKTGLWKASVLCGSVGAGIAQQCLGLRTDKKHFVAFRSSMPGQIAPPAFRRVTHAEGHGHVRLPGRLLGEMAQVHTALLERFAPLAPVAGNATGHDVGPIRWPAVCTRNNVVVGEFAYRRLASTVLALIIVAS